MQRLTAMTIGAAVLALCGFAYDASAQPPGTRAAAQSAACPAHEVAIYFAPGSSELNPYAKSAIDIVARTASACGAHSVSLASRGGPERADVVAAALQARGLNPFVSRDAGAIPAGDGVAARSVTLRLLSPAGASS